MFKTAGTEELDSPPHGIHEALAGLQEKTAFLPDYSFRSEAAPGQEAEAPAEQETPWPAVDPGTSLSGLVGGALTLVLALLIGIALKRRKKVTT
jgi:cobalt/nickel transport system permease protein